VPKDARTTDLTGFEVEADGEAVGRMHSATNDVDISFIVVDAALQPVLLPAGLISDVDARRRKVTLSCTAAEVRGAPRFDWQQGLAAPPSTGLVDDPAADDEAESAEATKDEVYAEAGRLDVRGRSTMTKDELSDELDRLQTEKASPIQVQAFLDGLQYPTDKGALLKEAEASRATAEVRATLERLPDRNFEDPTDISRAIGELP
jgi:Protein of unknown function (DUF2795)